MSARPQVVLVPGFFGFVNLGELRYFAHVRDALHEAFHAVHFAADVHIATTHPTASIEVRAARLAAFIATIAPPGAPIHLVGHSTGGLDARLLVTPAAILATPVPIEDIAERCRSVVCVATPHHGTPLAKRFATAVGQQSLRLLSLATIYMLRFGHVPLTIACRLGALFFRLDDRLGLKHTVMDQLFEQLMGDFSPERRAAVSRLFEESTLDQGILRDLDPTAASVFNGETPNRPGVRYGSVVTMAPPPRWQTMLHIGVQPYAQATHALFTTLYRVVAETPPIHVITPASDQIRQLKEVYGPLPDGRANDGIVPTLSQPWGELIHATIADHLDVIGHFNQPAHDPPHYDWLASGSGFDRRAFERLWSSVAHFIAET